MKKYEVIVEYKTWIFRRRKTVRVTLENENEEHARVLARFLFWARTGKAPKVVSARLLEDEDRE